MAQIRLGLRGGNASTQPVGAASLAPSLAVPKCTETGGLQQVGGWFGSTTGMTNPTSSVSVLSGNLANGMAALADQMRCREVDDETFLHVPRMLDAQSKVFERAEKRPEFIAGQRFFGELYPGHPYGDASFVNPAV